MVAEDRRFVQEKNDLGGLDSRVVVTQTVVQSQKQGGGFVLGDELTEKERIFEMRKKNVEKQRRRNRKGITDGNEKDVELGYRCICGTMVMARGMSMIIKSKVIGEIEKLVMGSEAQALSDATDSAEILEEVLNTHHNKYFGGDSPFEVDAVGSYVDNESVVKAVMTKDRQYLSVHVPDHVVLKLEHILVIWCRTIRGDYTTWERSIIRHII